MKKGVRRSEYDAEVEEIEIENGYRCTPVRLKSGELHPKQICSGRSGLPSCRPPLINPKMTAIYSENIGNKRVQVAPSSLLFYME